LTIVAGGNKITLLLLNYERVKINCNNKIRELCIEIQQLPQYIANVKISRYNIAQREVIICDRKRGTPGVNCVFKREANYVEKGI